MPCYFILKYFIFLVMYSHAYSTCNFYNRITMKMCDCEYMCYHVLSRFLKLSCLFLFLVYGCFFVFCFFGRSTCIKYFSWPNLKLFVPQFIPCSSVTLNFNDSLAPLWTQFCYWNSKISKIKFYWQIQMSKSTIPSALISGVPLGLEMAVICLMCWWNG